MLIGKIIDALEKKSQFRDQHINWLTPVLRTGIDSDEEKSDEAIIESEGDGVKNS